MSTPQYLRIHANATPTKLRAIIKDIIFVHDDVDYLKRLVKDLGGMDYVFRFLWYDGPVVVPTRSEDTNGGVDTVGNAWDGTSTTINPTPSSDTATNKQYGRTWIQHCCYHNAHQCLQWIFREIVQNHLIKEHNHQRQITTYHRTRMPELSALTISASERQAENSATATERDERDDNTKQQQGRNEKGLVKIIQQLLDFPSPAYCGINYMAVATLRNSHQCLSLLLEYGGLDPNMSINSHAATAAHLAAWKDHVECLRILQSGTYACRFDSDTSEQSIGSTTTADESDHQMMAYYETDDDEGFPHRDAFVSILTTPGGKEKMWSADWTRTNDIGETPLHVAAREGSMTSMQFFLDLAVNTASSSMDEEGEEDTPCTIDFSIRNNDGMDCAAVAAKHNQADIITAIWETIELVLDASIGGGILGVSSPQQQPVDFWQNPLSYFQHQPMKLPSVSHPSPVQTNRSRSKSEPFNIYSSSRNASPSTIKPPPQSPRHSHHNLQQCLPHYFPSLNFRNSLDRNNHEMPIHEAARHGNCAVIESFFKSGNCDTTARDSLGRTGLHVAALEGHLDACQLFVYLSGDQFENFDVVDVLGRTPLYISCSMGNPSLVRILINSSNWRVMCHERKKSTDGPLYADVAHQPPFHAAVVNDHVNTVTALLDCGVDVDQSDMDGRTALNAAAKLGYYDMCQMLILHGADVNKRSLRGGPTPYQKAKKYRHQEVADLLYEFGGR